MVEDLRSIHPQALAQLSPAQFSQLDRDGYLDMQFTGTMERAQDGLGTVLAKGALAIAGLFGCGNAESIGALTIDPKFKEMLFDPNADWGVGQMQRVVNPRLISMSSPQDSSQVDLRPPEPAPPYVPPTQTMPRPPQDDTNPDPINTDGLVRPGAASGSYVVFIDTDQNRDRTMHRNFQDLNRMTDPQAASPQGLEIINRQISTTMSDPQNLGHMTSTHYGPRGGFNLSSPSGIQTNLGRIRHHANMKGDGSERIGGQTFHYLTGDTVERLKIKTDPPNPAREAFYRQTMGLPSDAPIPDSANMLEVFNHQLANTTLSSLQDKMSPEQYQNLLDSYKNAYESIRPALPALQPGWEQKATLMDMNAVVYQAANIGSTPHFGGNLASPLPLNTDPNRPGMFNLSAQDQRKVGDFSMVMLSNNVWAGESFVINGQAAEMMNADIANFNTGRPQGQQITPLSPDRHDGQGNDDIGTTTLTSTVELQSRLYQDGKADNNVNGNYINNTANRTTQIYMPPQNTSNISNPAAFNTAVQGLTGNINRLPEVKTPPVASQLSTYQGVDTQAEVSRFAQSMGLPTQMPLTAPTTAPTPGSVFETLYNSVDTMPPGSSMTIGGTTFQMPDQKDAAKAQILELNKSAVGRLNTAHALSNERQQAYTLALTGSAEQIHTNVNSFVSGLETSFQDFKAYFGAATQQMPVSDERMNAMRGLVQTNGMRMVEFFNNILPENQRFSAEDMDRIRQDPAGMGPALYTLMDRARSATIPNSDERYFSDEQLRRMDDMVDILQTAQAQLGSSNEAAMLNNMNRTITDLNVRADQAIALLSGKMENLTQEIATDGPRANRTESREGSIDRMATRLRADMRQLASNPTAFNNLMQQVYGVPADSPKLEQMRQLAASGNFPLPQNIRFADFSNNPALQGKQGFHSPDNGGTIILNQNMLTVDLGNNRTHQISEQDLSNYPALTHLPEADRAKVQSQIQQMFSVFTEEAGHHLESVLGVGEVAGDEGQMFAESLYGAGGQGGPNALLSHQPNARPSNVNANADLTQATAAGRADASDRASGPVTVGGTTFNNVEFHEVPPSGTQPVVTQPTGSGTQPTGSGTQPGSDEPAPAPAPQQQQQPVTQTYGDQQPGWWDQMQMSTADHFVQQYGQTAPHMRDVFMDNLNTNAEGNVTSIADHRGMLQTLDAMHPTGQDNQIGGQVATDWASNSVLRLRDSDPQAFAEFRTDFMAMVPERLNDLTQKWGARIPGLEEMARRTGGAGDNTPMGNMRMRLLNENPRPDFDEVWQGAGMQARGKLSEISGQAENADDSSRLSVAVAEGGKFVANAFNSIAEIGEKMIQMWLEQYQSQVENSQFASGADQAIVASHKGDKVYKELSKKADKFLADERRRELQAEQNDINGRMQREQERAQRIAEQEQRQREQTAAP